MYDIEMSDVSREFAECWRAAGIHLQQHAQGPLKSWLKVNLIPPFLEHLSFRLGNQLFFVRLEDIDGNIHGPGNLSGLFSISDGCHGHPCIMPMRKSRGTWEVSQPNWGLLHARTGKPVDPAALITDELIEMTDWELQDFAVQVVRQQLEKEGRKLMSFQGNPSVDPSLWFVGDDGPEWVVVRTVRYPNKEAAKPSNWEQMADSCRKISGKGNFASVAVANANDTFDETRGPPLRLWRGHQLFANYEGLVPQK